MRADALRATIGRPRTKCNQHSFSLETRHRRGWAAVSIRPIRHLFRTLPSMKNANQETSQIARTTDLSISTRSKYDRRILTMVGYFGCVTSHQVLRKYFGASSYGERTIQRLIATGMLSAERLEPSLGRASRTVLSLTRDGYRRIAVTPPEGYNRPISGNLRAYRIQYAEVYLVREGEGWRFAKNEEAPAAVRVWTLRSYRNRLLNSSEQAVRDALERGPIKKLPMRVMHHPATGRLRFILPVRPGFLYQKLLKQMPNTGLWPALELEVVCSDMSRIDDAELSVMRWAKRVRANVTMHRVAHHRTQPHPRNGPPKGWAAQDFAV